MSEAATSSPVRVDARNPWPGLDPFTETASAFFNGRGEEAAALRRLVRDSTLTVLFGKSGLGKSSLLQAGLFPRLRDEDLLPVLVRLDPRDNQAPIIEQVMRTLRQVFAAEGIDHTPIGAGDTLWEYLHRRDLELWSRRNRLLTPVIVLDQFEEVFTLGAGHGAPAVARLGADLADLIENRIPDTVSALIEAGDALLRHLDLQRQPYKVVLALREDFLAELESWSREIPSLLRSRLRLLPMSGAQAFEAVFKTGGRIVDATIARAIVTFVGDAGRETAEHVPAAVPPPAPGADAPEHELVRDIEPALLSLVCRRLNDARRQRRKRRIDDELLRRQGTRILDDFYESCLAALPEQARERVRRLIEDQLITEAGYRNPVARDDAIARGLISEAELQALIDARLLRVEPHLGTERVELTHDRLTSVVRASRERFRAGETERRLEREKAEALRLAERQALETRNLMLLLTLALAARKEADRRAREAKRNLDRLQKAIAEVKDRTEREALTKKYLPDSVRQLTDAGRKRLAAKLSAVGPPIRARPRTPPQYGLKLWEVGATLQVRFMGGTPAQQSKVQAAAREWMKYANLKFEFGSMQDAEVRIAFKPDDGSWAYTGTDALGVPATQPTVNLGWVEEYNVLHELGHVLGLIHETNNPNVDLKWNKEVVYRDLCGPPNNWSKEQVDRVLLEKYEDVEYRPFDPGSIMSYDYPASWFLDGRAIVGGKVLSESDKAFVRKLYPPD